MKKSSSRETVNALSKKLDAVMLELKNCVHDKVKMKKQITLFERVKKQYFDAVRKYNRELSGNT